MRRGAGEFVRFLVSGGINTAASYALYLLLLRFMHYLVAYTLAYVAGIALSYALMTRFVFRARPQWTTAVRFPLVYAAQFVVGSGTTFLLVEGAGISPAWAAAVAIVIVVPVTFAVARYVFSR